MLRKSVEGKPVRFTFVVIIISFLAHDVINTFDLGGEGTSSKPMREKKTRYAFLTVCKSRVTHIGTSSTNTSLSILPTDAVSTNSLYSNLSGQVVKTSNKFSSRV